MKTTNSHARAVKIRQKMRDFFLNKANEYLAKAVELDNKGDAISAQAYVELNREKVKQAHEMAKLPDTVILFMEDHLVRENPAYKEEHA